MFPNKMDPTLLPALYSIHDAIAVEGQELILFENGTYLLIREEDTIEYLINNIGKFDKNKIVKLNMHFYSTHEIRLFMQPDFPTIGNLRITEKGMKFGKTGSGEIPFVIECMVKDMKEQKVIVDSRKDKLEDLTLAMYFIVNSSLGMGKGKIAAQVGHAVETLTENLLEKGKQDYWNWKLSTRKKVVLKASGAEIQDFLDNVAKRSDDNTIIDNSTFITVRDAGMTQIEPGSLTVLAFVPMEKRVVPEFVKNLKLL